MASVQNIRESKPETDAQIVQKHMKRAETAAQLVAVMQARMDKPSPDEMRAILEQAGEQVDGLEKSLRDQLTALQRRLLAQSVRSQDR